MQQRVRRSDCNEARGYRVVDANKKYIFCTTENTWQLIETTTLQWKNVRHFDQHTPAYRQYDITYNGCSVTGIVTLQWTPTRDLNVENIPIVCKVIVLNNKTQHVQVKF